MTIIHIHKVYLLSCATAIIKNTTIPLKAGIDEDDIMFLFNLIKKEIETDNISLRYIEEGIPRYDGKIKEYFDYYSTIKDPVGVGRYFLKKDVKLSELRTENHIDNIAMPYKDTETQEEKKEKKLRIQGRKTLDNTVLKISERFIDYYIIAHVDIFFKRKIKARNF